MKKRRMLPKLAIFSVILLLIPSIPAQQDLQTLVNQFIISKVGEKYFKEHYVPVSAKYEDNNIIFAEYLYNYPPYVKDYEFRIYYDIARNDISEKGNSCILLEPQKINIDKERTIQIAEANGMYHSGDYRLKIDFSNEKFLWSIEDFRAYKLNITGLIYWIYIDLETEEIMEKFRINVSPYNNEIYITTPVSNLVIFGIFIMIVSIYLLLTFRSGKMEIHISEKGIFSIGMLIALLIYIFFIYQYLHDIIVASGGMKTWENLSYEYIFGGMMLGLFIPVGITTYWLLYKFSRNIPTSFIGSIFFGAIGHWFIWSLVIREPGPTIGWAFLASLIFGGILYASLALIISYLLYIHNVSRNDNKLIEKKKSVRKKGKINEYVILNFGAILALIISIFLFFWRLSFYIEWSGGYMDWDKLGLEEYKGAFGWMIFLLSGMIAYRNVYFKNRKVVKSLLVSTIVGFGFSILYGIILMFRPGPDTYWGYVDVIKDSGIIFITFALILSLALFLLRRGEKNEI